MTADLGGLDAWDRRTRELLPRELHPQMSRRIWTGSVMQWSPPRRLTYVTALEDQVPPNRLGDLADRLLGAFLEPVGRLVPTASGRRLLSR